MLKDLKASLINKKTLIYIFTIVISIVFIIIGNKITSRNLDFLKGSGDITAEKAKVTKIVKIKPVKYDLGGDKPESGKDIVFSAKIISGDKKNTEVLALQSIDPFTGVSFKEVKAGDKVILYKLDNKDSTYDYVLGEYLRTDSLLVLGIVFLVMLIIFGRFKGFNTILSLVFTSLAIFAVFIPAVLQGLDIYFWSIITCIFIITMSMLIIYGLNKKSLAAAIGSFVGILTSGVLILIMNKFLNLTGLVSEESLYVVRINPTHPIDLKGVIFASILIGAIGAVMDVSMSIAASLSELKDKLEYVPFSLLVKSGMSIGRDIMGTMANTLILAYIGSSLSVVLLMVSYNSSLLELLNKEMIVVEILQALIGSIGILSTIPLTTFVYAYLFSEKTTREPIEETLEEDYQDEYTDGWK